MVGALPCRVRTAEFIVYIATRAPAIKAGTPSGPSGRVLLDTSCHARADGLLETASLTQLGHARHVKSVIKISLVAIDPAHKMRRISNLHGFSADPETARAVRIAVAQCPCLYHPPS